MRRLILQVVVVLAIATSLPIVAAEDTTVSSKPPSKVIGRDIAPFLKNANAALQRKDWDLAAEQLAKADALPNKSEYEQGLIDQMRKFILFKTATPAFHVKDRAELLLEKKQARPNP